MSQRFSIPEDHPCLAGHFPGNPLVPGVVILDRVLAIARDQVAEKRIGTILSCKFVSPLLAGQSVSVTWEPDPADTILSFRCYRDEELICTGRLALSATAP